MGTKLYVGNLSYDTTETQIRELFAQVGEISEIALITDRETGRSKGFGTARSAALEVISRQRPEPENHASHPSWKSAGHVLTLALRRASFSW